MCNSVCMNALLSSISFPLASLSQSLTGDDDGRGDDHDDCYGMQVSLFKFFDLNIFKAAKGQR